MPFPAQRLRRLRRTPALRDLIRETSLSPKDFVLPLFVRHGKGEKRPIVSMPGHFQYSVDTLKPVVRRAKALGIPGVIVFGIPKEKDSVGSDAHAKRGVIQRALREIKETAPELAAIADLCFCEYTDHGHCGKLVADSRSPDGQVLDNDSTLKLLRKAALSQAEAGADVIAPSGMIDGMVGEIRQALDRGGFEEIPILSYAVKYASAFYGPFRDAAESPPSFGDRSTYQMDPGNVLEGLREARLDVEEGADMLMVKPALSYLDVVSKVKTAYGLPTAAYSVSGEFAMTKAAAANGWIDEKKVALEALTSIKRAGADFILTYYALEAAEWLG